MKYVEAFSLFRGLLKTTTTTTTTTAPRNLLGLNVSTVSVGLAVSRQQNKLASPLNLLIPIDEDMVYEDTGLAMQLQILASTYSADGFVVAYPLDRLRNAKRLEVFMDKLSMTTELEGIKYTYWNRRFSTASVEAAVEHLDLYAMQHELLFNRFYAVSTLQDYLDCMNEKHEAELNMKYVNPFSLFTNLLKTSIKPRKLLGLNVGTEYVGLAVSDQHNKLASYLSFLLKRNENTEENIEWMATEFQSLASEHSIEGFVVSYPFDRLRLNPDAKPPELLIFMDKLSKTRKLEGIEYTYWHNRFGRSMEDTVHAVGLDPLESEFVLNRFSAFSMLQEYLDYMNKKQEAELKF